MKPHKVVVIYNIEQANTFLKNGAKVLGFQKHRETKHIGIIFENSQSFQELMTKWRNYDLPK